MSCEWIDDTDVERQSRQCATYEEAPLCPKPAPRERSAQAKAWAKDVQAKEQAMARRGVRFVSQLLQILRGTLMSIPTCAESSSSCSELFSFLFYFLCFLLTCMCACCGGGRFVSQSLQILWGALPSIPTLHYDLQHQSLCLSNCMVLTIEEQGV